MLTTIIFDLDDTLYNETEYCKSGFRAVAQELTKQPQAVHQEDTFNAIWEQFSLGNHTRTFNTALSELGLGCDENLIKKLVSVYRNHKPVISLPTESRDILEHLTGKYCLALLTDGYLPGQKYKVDSLGIEKYFNCIVYTEELGRDCWKPSTAGFERILHFFGILPSQAVYIADNEEKDFIAPNKLGILSIKISLPGGIYSSINKNPGAGPVHKINKISELPALIEKIQTTKSKSWHHKPSGSG